MSRRQLKNLTNFVKKFNILEFHYHIWNRHDKCIRKSINMLGIGSLILEINVKILDIWEQEAYKLLLRKTNARVLSVNRYGNVPTRAWRVVSDGMRNPDALHKNSSLYDDDLWMNPHSLILQMNFTLPRVLKTFELRLPFITMLMMFIRLIEFADEAFPHTQRSAMHNSVCFNPNQTAMGT